MATSEGTVYPLSRACVAVTVEGGGSRPARRTTGSRRGALRKEFRADEAGSGEEASTGLWERSGHDDSVARTSESFSRTGLPRGRPRAAEISEHIDVAGAQAGPPARRTCATSWSAGAVAHVAQAGVGFPARKPGTRETLAGDLAAGWLIHSFRWSARSASSCCGAHPRGPGATSESYARAAGRTPVPPRAPLHGGRARPSASRTQFRPSASRGAVVAVDAHERGH